MKRLILDNIVYYNERISYRKLKDINVTFDSGTLYLIISDKKLDALLLSILIGLEIPASGSIIYNEKILKNKNDFNDYQRSIGTLIINDSLLNNETVMINYELILSDIGLAKTTINERVVKLFNQYEINTNILSKKVKMLSNEERCYMLFILAIVNEPDLIIINDIFHDSKVRKKLLEWLKELCSKNDTTVIFFTQERESLTLADEIWRFNDGRLTFVKKIEDK